MNNKVNRDIAITFENFIQYQSLKFGIDYLIKKGIKLDIYVPISNNDTGFNDMYNDIYDFLISTGYNVYRNNNDNIFYKVLLEPYPMDGYFNFNYEYRIKYKYGLSAKPDPVYKPEWNIFYDAVLVNGIYETEFFNVYAKTHIIGNLKYVNYKKNLKNMHKKILLYLPTYGDLSSIEEVANVLNTLKNEYKIITKLHHGTSFLKSEDGRQSIIQNCSDEIYDQHKPLIDLLSEASVVLSDNSGAVFEAICAEVPVCIYSKSLRKSTLGEFTPLQYDLVCDGIIPFTDDVAEIRNIIKLAVQEEYVKKQKDTRNYLFSIENKKMLENFYDIINEYLNMNKKSKYKRLHDNLSKDYKAKMDLIKQQEVMIIEKDAAISRFLEQIRVLKLENQDLNKIIFEKERIITEKDEIISVYRKGKLYRLAEKTYQFTNSFQGKKEVK